VNITLRQLEVFLAVIDTQSTTRGAEKLSLSQSAVSSALADLENQLGCNCLNAQANV
jgi:Transcriptional regulator